MTDTQFGTKGAMLIIATLALGLVTAPAQASLTLFTGADDGAGSLATAPNSTAAAASFDAAVAALGTEQIITFENSPVGAFSSLILGTGITLTGARAFWIGAFAFGVYNIVTFGGQSAQRRMNRVERPTVY